MLHVIIGTKAQMVKMAPLMALFEKRGIEYNFVLTGQHKDTMDDIRENFSIKSPDCVLYKGKDITSVFGICFWFFYIFIKVCLNRKRVFKGDNAGVVLTHGDTFSTALAAVLAKAHGHKVGHVESGLRSFNIFHPFPEELTRLLVFSMTDYYFCPGIWAVNNVKAYRGRKINTLFNTQMDSVRSVWDEAREDNGLIKFKSYCVVTSHRFENWSSKTRATKSVEIIERVVEKVPGVFVLHPITEKKLLKYGLFRRLEENPNIQFLERTDFSTFIQILAFSLFVVTDGGSNQEECSYLGKPCLLLRYGSERLEGLDDNVVVSCYELGVVHNFVSNYHLYRRPVRIEDVSPCDLICRFLVEEKLASPEIVG